MTAEVEPSVQELAKLWAKMQQIRNEYRVISGQRVDSFYEGENKKQKLFKLEAAHLAVAKALGIAGDALFDPFEDVPRPRSAEQVDVPGVRNQPQAVLQLTAPTSMCVTPPKGSRRNALTPVIDKAISACGQRKDAAEVFNKLREWASEKPVRHHPLLGVTPCGIQWLDSNDEVKELSRDALAHRLKRHR